MKKSRLFLNNLPKTITSVSEASSKRHFHGYQFQKYETYDNKKIKLL